MDQAVEASVGPARDQDSSSPSTRVDNGGTNRRRHTVAANGAVVSHHHKLSSSLRMDDVGLLMREQDAELLESIHINGANQCSTTPALTSTSAPLDSLMMPPPLSLLNDCSFQEDEEDSHLHSTTSIGAEIPSLRMRQGNPLLPPLPSTASIGLTRKYSNELTSQLSARISRLPPIDSMPGTPSVSPRREQQQQGRSFAMTTILNPAERTQLTVEKCVNRRVLSGEIFQEEVVVSFVQDPTTAATDLGQVADVIESSYVNITTAVDESSNHVLKRTESKERRMHEAAQFAEAVGDLPLTEQEGLRIIEDCDAVIDDDDDDDDATEVHIQRKTGVMKRIDARAGALLECISDPPEAPTPPPLVCPETPIKTRPQWPAERLNHHLAVVARIGTDASRNRAGFLTQLPSSVSSSQDFVYKGIRANPPEIVKRGTTRGNYAQLHRKAWLEVSDKYHRYGKHLRLYYRYWERLGCPTNMFFDWLDSKGEAAGQPLPELAECPRSQLDSDTVLYISNPDVTQGYAVQFVVEELPQVTAGNEEGLRRGRVVDVDGDPVRTGPDGWIFVLRDNVMYGALKITSVSGHSKQRFHHSSFFGGKAVAAAGIFITDDEGYLTRLYPHSGHYRPGDAHMQRVLFFLYNEGVDLRTFVMDMQQIMHVARDSSDLNAPDKVLEQDKNEAAVSEVGTGTEGKKEKKKKVESLHLMSAVSVACFLAHKARFIGEGIFAQIRQIRKSDVANVTEALAVIDNGGIWAK